MPVVVWVAVFTHPTMYIGVHDWLFQHLPLPPTHGPILCDLDCLHRAKCQDLQNAEHNKDRQSHLEGGLAQLEESAPQHVEKALTLSTKEAPTSHEATAVWNTRGTNEGVKTTSLKLVMKASVPTDVVSTIAWSTLASTSWP